MKKSILFIAVFLPLICFSQTEEEIIADAVCKNLSKLNLSESPNSLNQKALNTIQKAYQDFQPKILDLMVVYKKKHPGLSDLDLSKLIGQEITVYLMDKCVPYQRITMFQSQPVPKLSETTKMIGEKYTELLMNRSKSQKITQNLIDDCIIEVTDKYANLVKQKYGDRYSEKFIKEFQTYLMTESLPHIRWMAHQIK